MDGLLANSTRSVLKFAGHDFVMPKWRAGLQGVGKGARKRLEKEEAGRDFALLPPSQQPA